MIIAMLDTTPLQHKLGVLEQTLRRSGLAEPTDRFAGLVAELQAGPSAEQLVVMLEGIRDSSHIARDHEFDLDARRRFAEMWAVARIMLDQVPGGEPSP